MSYNSENLNSSRREKTERISKMKTEEQYTVDEEKMED